MLYIKFTERENLLFPYSHLIQYLGISFGQFHDHGVSNTGEFDGVGVLAVLLLIQSCSCCLGFLHLQGTNWNPADPLH